MRQVQTLIDVFEITEYRNGCIYRTAFVEQKWVPAHEKPPEGFLYAPLSSTDPNFNASIRSVEVDESPNTPVKVAIMEAQRAQARRLHGRTW